MLYKLCTDLTLPFILKGILFSVCTNRNYQEVLEYNKNSKSLLDQKIIVGEMDWHFIEILLPYAEYLTSQIEAAVIEGALPNEALDILYRYYWDENGYKNRR